MNKEALIELIKREKINPCLKPFLLPLLSCWKKATNFSFSEKKIDVPTFLATYERRKSHLTSKGIITKGFDETFDYLKNKKTKTDLRMATFSCTDLRYCFLLESNPDEDAFFVAGAFCWEQ